MTESQSPTSNIWGDRLLAVLLVLLTISFLSILVLGSYFDQPITQALSFDIQDGQCDPATEGLGLHCFGDYQYVREQLSPNIESYYKENPANIYSPTGLLPNLIVKPIQELYGTRLGLFIFLLLMTVAISTPALYASAKKFRSHNRVSKFCFLTLLAQPFIFAIDRGTSVGFAMPFLALFAIKLDRKPNWNATLAVVGAASIRPQFALIAVGLLAFRQIKHFFFATLGIFLVVIIPFVFWPGDARNNIAMWLRNITSYSQGAKTDITDRYPVNISMRSAFDHLFRGKTNQIALFFSNHYLLVSLVILLIVICSLFLCHKTNRKATVLIVSLSLPCLIPETSFGYYSLFTLVIAAQIFSDRVFFDGSLALNTNRPKLWLDNLYSWIVIFALGVALAPLPFVVEVGRNSISLEYFGAIWGSVLIFTVAKIVNDFRVASL